MASKIVTEPDGEPISLELAKLHLRVTGDSEDELIQIYVRSARKWIEERTHRSMLDQTWELSGDAFPRSAPFEIMLPLGRVSKVNNIKYFDEAAVEQTLTGPTSAAPGTDYQEDLNNESGPRIRPTPANDWPSSETDRLAAVTVQFVSGYGPKASDVPAGLVTGLLYRLTDLDEFRGSIDGSGTENAKAEVDAYRLNTW